MHKNCETCPMCKVLSKKKVPKKKKVVTKNPRESDFIECFDTKYEIMSH